jgi:hypothetical protein
MDELLGIHVARCAIVAFLVRGQYADPWCRRIADAML